MARHFLFAQSACSICGLLHDDGLLPLSRFGQPDDVAKMVYACCTGLLDYSAGQVLNADGGFNLRRL